MRLADVDHTPAFRARRVRWILRQEERQQVRAEPGRDDRWGAKRSSGAGSGVRLLG
jgi:hypothetical protein